MAESRGGKEDKRLKASFLKLWNEGTPFVPPDKFQEVFTSKQLKVWPKANNISGLQLADLIAHPSLNEILNENKILERPIAPFAGRIISILKKIPSKGWQGFWQEIYLGDKKGPFGPDGGLPSTST